MLPVDTLGIGRILQNTIEPEDRRIARVKSHVLQQLDIRTSGGETVLMEISGETFTYDRDVPWLISALTSETQDDGTVATSTVMRQPLGAGPISCASFLPYAELIVQRAFETHDDKLCVPRQLAEVLGVSLSETINILTSFSATGKNAG